MEKFGAKALAVPIGFLCLALLIPLFVYLAVSGAGQDIITAIQYAELNDPKVIADRLLHDYVWGFKAIPAATRYGNEVATLLSESDEQFTRSTRRNALFVADFVMAANSKGLEQLATNYERGPSLNRILIATCVRAKNGTISQKQRDLLMSICLNPPKEDKDALAVRLALRSLRYLAGPEVTPAVLHAVKVASNEESFGQRDVEREAIDVLKCQKVKDRETVLVELLSFKQFWTTDLAFDALYEIDPEKAVKVALHRLNMNTGVPDKDLLAALYRRTGKVYVKDTSGVFSRVQ